MQTSSLQRLFPHPLVRAVLAASCVLVLLAIFTVLIHTALGDTLLGADFFTFWSAGRAALLNGQNPYSHAVTLESQMGIYGRPALPSEDQVAFAYPPYSLLILLPLLPLPFSWAYALWMSINLVSLLTLLYVLPLGEKRLPALTALLFYPIFFCLVTGNFSVIMGCAILYFFGFAEMRGERSLAFQISSAVLLAWATTKPQFLWLATVFILLYTLRKKMFPFLFAYAATFFGCLVFSFIITPGWLVEWPARVQAYVRYVNGAPVITNLLNIFLPQTVSEAITWVFFALALAGTVTIFTAWWRGKLTWLHALAWVGLITFSTHLHGMANEQAIFLVPLTLWFIQQRSSNEPATWLFWVGSIVLSWVAFVAGISNPSFDHIPVILNAAWVAWLLKKTDPIQA